MSDKLKNYLVNDRETVEFKPTRASGVQSLFAKLESLGILTDYTLERCLSNVVVDPMGVIATVVRVLQPAGVFTETVYQYEDDVAFELSDRPPRGKVQVRVNLFDSTLSFYLIHDGVAKVQKVFKPSELFKILTSKEKGEERLAKLRELIETGCYKAMNAKPPAGLPDVPFADKA